MASCDLGVMFRREDLPENVVSYSQQAEAAGFDELWIVEDCFYASGIAPVTMALAATERIRVGLGIMPAVSRNAAFAAMEFTTLARLFPGRFAAGIGHGVRKWMEQIGALPVSQLAALSETTEVIRCLLRGEPVTYSGQHVVLSDVQLEFPPEQVPPVSLGVRGPKSLQLSGRVADGTLLAEGSSPAYVEWARAQIDQGRAAADRTDDHRISEYVLCAIDDDADAARERMRPFLARILVYGKPYYFDALGIADEIQPMLAAGKESGDPVGHMIAAMPDAWLHDMAVVGTPEQGADTIRRLVAAGVDSVVLVPLPTGDFAGQLATFAERLLPEVQKQS